jgi:hypothetical protein
MTCKDCIHEYVCDLKRNHYYLGQPIGQIDCAEIACRHFKVYCEKCKYRHKEGFCFKNINGVGYKLVLPNDFCSYGKHEEDN